MPSTDAAPALIALGAHINLHSAKDGTRTVALADLYQNDGIDYMARRPDEILTEIKLEDPKGWKTSYWKLRRRGSFDFPVLGAAAAVKLNDQGIVKEARIVLGAVASWPIVCKEAAESLIDQPLTDAAIAEAGAKAGRKAKPMDNTDFTLHWRKRVASEFVAYALRELRGDDLTQIRKRVARHELIPPI